jgi:general secretion pathway protein J
MMHAKTQRGFTLIELLVALVILTFISVAGYRGLNAVLQTRERVAEETRKWQHLAFFFSRMELDVAQAVRRPVRDSDGSNLPEWIGHNVTVGENDAELTFTRAGIPDQGTEMQPPQRIAYRFERGSIVMLRWPALDQAPNTNPMRYPLLNGVREFKLRYFDRDNNWLEQWPPVYMPDGTPSAVELNITLTSGEKITRIFALQ